MIFRQIAHGTADYEREIRLRDEILRRPLGLSLRDEDLSAESGHLHFGLFDAANDLAACVVAVPLSGTEVRIRQMAVSASQQGKGVGKALMEELEKSLRSLGFQRFVLNARTSAVGFYEKLGYAIEGDEFVDLTIPHFRMGKAAVKR